MTNVGSVDTKTFQDAVDHYPVLVVDFYADWCGPCKIVAPTMEKLAVEYDGRAKFVKLDVDRSPVIAEEFGVMSIPTLILFKNGKPVERTVGAASADYYRKIIARVL